MVGRYPSQRWFVAECASPDGLWVIHQPEDHGHLGPHLLFRATFASLPKLGVGRSKPLEIRDLATQPVWAFLEPTENRFEPILISCIERAKSSPEISA